MEDHQDHQEDVVERAKPVDPPSAQPIGVVDPLDKAQHIRLPEPEVIPDAPRPALKRSLWTHQMPVKYDDYDLNIVSPTNFNVYAIETIEPTRDDITLSKVFAYKGWTATMHEELDSLLCNRTWELVPLPPGRHALTSKWVFKTKPMVGGTRAQLKARLVAHGLEQKEGIDFMETFTPVVCWSTLRLIIALAVTYGWSIHHMDVVTTILNGILTETIYMRQPPGFIKLGCEDLVCRLIRAIYGLKQSPQAWYSKIDNFLYDNGWCRSTVDPTLYFLYHNTSLVIMMLYVDDLLITGNDPILIDEVKNQLKSCYEMEVLGQAQCYLGVDFTYSSHGLLIHQKEYCKALLEVSGMASCPPESTPLSLGYVITSETNTPLIDVNEYCHLVGNLIFLTHARPDIGYVVGIVRRVMSRPQQKHLETVHHILHYLKGTSDLGIFFQKNFDVSLHGFPDVDYLGCIETRRSIRAYVFQIVSHPISWSRT